MGAGTIEGRLESILKTIFIGIYSRIVRAATMRTRKSLDDEAAAMEKVESEVRLRPSCCLCVSVCMCMCSPSPPPSLPPVLFPCVYHLYFIRPSFPPSLPPSLQSAVFSIPNQEAYAAIDTQRNAGPYEVCVRPSLPPSLLLSPLLLPYYAPFVVMCPPSLLPSLPPSMHRWRKSTSRS